MDLFSSPERIALAAIPMILGITLHEAAHGYVARQFGDSTAWMLGRVTLNPLKHIDLLGTIIVPGLLLLAGTGFLFGWAKPVPVNFGNLRHPKRDMLWVAAAGPAMNFVMALAWSVLFGAASGGGVLQSPGVQFMAYVGVVINISLMVLNLLPIPPLDGGRIAVSLLPGRLANAFASLERFGFIILLVLLATRVLGTLMMPFVVGVGALIETITGVHLPGFD